VLALIETMREWERRRRESPALDPFDPDYRRLRYCRYADDFVIGVIGSKADARNIMAEISQWLMDNLKLQVSREKSGIAKSDEGVDCLGCGMRMYRSDRLTRKVVGGRAVTARAAHQMQLHVPEDRPVRFARR